MKKWKEFFYKDLKRYGGRKSVDSKTKRLLKYLRKCQYPTNKFSLLLNKYQLKRIREKMFIEVFEQCQIGEGLYIGHPYCITINPRAIIGKNCNIHKGVVIGQENRGERNGTPKIGDDVWIGINAAIVGNITVGNDVLIAPNTFVNCDVPSHSVVFGNPCIIKKKNNATKDYVNNRVD